MLHLKFTLKLHSPGTSVSAHCDGDHIEARAYAAAYS